jgi:diacylglycerol kinase (ATP)
MIEEDHSVPNAVAAVLLACALVLFLWGEQKQSESVEVKLARLGFAAGKHLWQDSVNTGLYYCNVCKGLMVSSMKECQKCGLLVHSLCRFKSKPHCKYVSAHAPAAEHLHQWLQGNLAINTICSVCHHLCAGLVSLDCYRCMWCQRAVHSECKKVLPLYCDFGRLRAWILEPSRIQAEHKLSVKGKKSKKATSENSESEEEFGRITIEPDVGKWPILVVINKKSGGQLGSAFLKQYYCYLNPIQVVNFPSESLEIVGLLVRLPRLRVIVGGGDGTICGVASYIKGLADKLGIEPPPIAPLPLGTGNDLSRALGWGHDYEQHSV